MAVLKKITAALLLVFSLSACSGPDKKAPVSSSDELPKMSKEDGKIITEKEISVWEFSKTKQFDKLRSILADDYIGYFSSGDMRPSDVINLLKNTTIRSYHLSNISVKPVSNDVAIITYDVQQDVQAADGSKWIPEVGASSTYVKRKGIWYSVFYQEMPLR